MWVKICANTNAADAALAVEMGADAVGFVFAPSVRQVTAEQVRGIVTERVERVGVFGKLGAEEIASAAETARLTAVQLHGGLDLQLAEELGRLLERVEVIHTVHWRVGDSAEAERVTADLNRLAVAAPGARVLVDAKVGDASGGLGVSYDWEAAGAVLRGAASAGLRVIAAGGLRPDNVGGAIRTMEPWGVDVASGVEAQPGLKDEAKVREFIERARKG